MFKCLFNNQDCKTCTNRYYILIEQMLDSYKSAGSKNPNTAKENVLDFFKTLKSKKKELNVKCKLSKILKIEEDWG